MRISKRSQVLVPSPQGDLRVVMRSTLVGMRTGPFTLSCLSLAPRIRSPHTVGCKQRVVVAWDPMLHAAVFRTASALGQACLLLHQACDCCVTSQPQLSCVY